MGSTAPSQARGHDRPDSAAAASMLMSALFADAMGRDMMPMMYPQPAHRAPAAYVKVFLAALGARLPSSQTTARSPRAGSV